MNIQAEKLELVRMILETDNPGILMTIKRIFQNSGKKDFWMDLSNEQRKEILIGLDDFDNGNITDYEDVISKHRG
jgi:hypothetical protein